MLTFNFRLRNPWIKPKFDNHWCREGKFKFTQYKCYCVELLHNADTLLALDLDLNWQGKHHAGPNITVGFIGYEFSIQIYDSRHWDYELNCWEKYNGIPS